MRIQPRNAAAVSLGFAAIAAVVGIVLGVTSLLEWMVGGHALHAALNARHLSLNPMTAVCFVCSGAALWLARESRRSRARDAARVLMAAIVVVITLSKVVDLFPHVTLPIDELLFRHQIRVSEAQGGDPSKGKVGMAPNTAAGLLFVGLSLLLFEFKPIGRARLSTIFALLAASIALLALIGYMYHVQVLAGMPKYIAMAINTAVGLLMVSIGILCVRPNRQPIAILVSGTAGGVVARRLVPVAIAVPLLLGWGRLWAERKNYFDTGVGVMLFAMAIVAVFLTLIWWIARALYRLDLERARAEALAADNYQLMRTLIDNLPDRIYAKDRESRFLIDNAAHRKVLGASTPEEIRGKTDLDFFPPDVARPFFEEEQRIVATGQGIEDQEQQRKNRTGEERWVTVTKVPFRNAQGDIAGIVGITHDVTAIKHAQSMLHEQNEMLQQSMRSEKDAHETLKRTQSQLVQNEKLASLGQMVAGVAHEINNPLSFVANNVAVLQRDLKALGQLLEMYRQADDSITEKQPELSAEIKDLAERVDLAYTLPNLQELLTRSREGLRRIQQIVKDLRDFARLDEADLHEVDLNDGIQSTANIVLGLAKKKRVKVEMDLQPLPTVSCYPAKLNQVVMNLIANAIQASHEGGTVTVRSRRNGDDTILIEVADQGTGIPQRIRDRIFDPFFTTKPPGEGTGLGLSISYGIVQDHGGRIDVQSEEGKGSTFTITLPVGKAEPNR
jgi:PAS domain S-box-containing protein